MPFSSCLPSSCPTVPPLTCLNCCTLSHSLCPARRWHQFNSVHTGSRRFQNSFPPGLALPAPVHVCNCQSIPHQNQGPLAQGMVRRHAKTWFPASEKFPPQKREPAEQNTAANGTQSLRRTDFKNKQAPWAGKVLVHFCSYVNNSKVLFLARLETDGITGNSGE